MSFIEFVNSRLQIEAAPANNVGGGQIAGVSPGEVPPVRKKKKKKLQTTKWKSFRAMPWGVSGGWHDHSGSGECDGGGDSGG